MIPSIIYERVTTDSSLQSIAGISAGRVFELQSVDKRPFDSGCFIVFNWQESVSFGGFAMNSSIAKAPRTLTVWVHSPMDRGRDYRQIDKVLNRIEEIFLSMEQQKGTDNVRVTCIDKQGRSGNLIDDGWKTITRNATYRVLYDENAV